MKRRLSSGPGQIVQPDLVVLMESHGVGLATVMVLNLVTDHHLKWCPAIMLVHNAPTSGLGTLACQADVTCWY